MTSPRYVTRFRLDGLWGPGSKRHYVDIPAGTQCVSIERGDSAGKFQISDLSWIPDNDWWLRHDVQRYHIVLEPTAVCTE